MRERASASQAADLKRDEARALFWDKWLCMSAIAVVLVVGTTLFCYAQPLADDFARAYKGRLQGVFPAMIAEYFHWSGRWASSTLNYFITSSFDLVRLYPLLLVVNAALLAVSIFSLLHAAEIGTAIRQRLCLTAAALALYWAGMPDPGETVYWLTGSVDNLTGLWLSLLLFAGLLQSRMQKGPAALAIGAGLSLLALVAAGFHELFSLLLCLALAGGTLRGWLARDEGRWMWTACLAAALVGFLVVYNAPGNAVRRAEFPFAANFGVTMRLTVQQVISDVLPWILDVRLLFGTALILLLAPECIKDDRRQRSELRDLVIVVLTWVAVLIAAVAAASWATGSNLILRTLDGIYLVFLTGWFWVFVMAKRHFGRREPLLAATPLLRRTAATIFVAAMLLTGNTWKQLRDLRGAAPAYSNAMGDRWRLLEAASAKGTPHVTVKPVWAHPKSYIAYFELREDPNYWENRSVANYFGLRSVRMAGKSDKGR